MQYGLGQVFLKLRGKLKLSKLQDFEQTIGRDITLAIRLFVTWKGMNLDKMLRYKIGSYDCLETLIPILSGEG